MIRPCDMMVVAMSRLIGDGDTVFHGVSSHMPMIATLLAKKTHAPNAVHLNIPGGVDPVKPALREYTSAGGELWESACAKLPLMEVFDLSKRGGLDVEGIDSALLSHLTRQPEGVVTVAHREIGSDPALSYVRGYEFLFNSQ